MKLEPSVGLLRAFGTSCQIRFQIHVRHRHEEEFALLRRFCYLFEGLELTAVLVDIGGKFVPDEHHPGDLVDLQDLVDPFDQVFRGEVEVNVAGMEYRHDVAQQRGLQGRIANRFFQFRHIGDIAGQVGKLALQFVPLFEEIGLLFRDTVKDSFQRTEDGDLIPVFTQCLNDGVFDADQELFRCGQSVALGVEDYQRMCRTLGVQCCPDGFGDLFGTPVQPFVHPAFIIHKKFLQDQRGMALTCPVCTGQPDRLVASVEAGQQVPQQRHEGLVRIKVQPRFGRTVDVLSGHARRIIFGNSKIVFIVKHFLSPLLIRLISARSHRPAFSLSGTP